MITLLSICRRVQQQQSEKPDGGAASDSAAAQAALESQVQLVLLNLVRLVRSVHAVWDPALRSMLPPTWQQVVYRALEYEAAVDGAAGAAAIATLVGEVSAKGEEERRAIELCGWLRHVRDGAYQVSVFVLLYQRLRVPKYRC